MATAVGRGPEEAADPRARKSISERVAVGVFALGMVVAGPLIVRWNREQWFWLDEWDFLAARDLHSADDLLRPHNEHWTTVPIILYRVIFRMVGLDHYWLYQVPVVLAHLACVGMLWLVLRRARVHPWIATAVGILLLFLGSGRSNLAWGFQIAFTGAVAFGLAHLLLADRDGPWGRRDLLALGFGAVALLFSGIGMVMVVVVGTATVIRRGWKLAVLHTAPLLGVYAIWYVIYGTSENQVSAPTPRQALGFMRWAVWDSFMGLGQHGLVAVGLVALGVVGVVMVGSSFAQGERDRYHAVAGLACGGLAVLVVTATGRASSVPFGSGLTPSRYVYLIVAFWIPLVAVGANALVARARWAGIPVALLLLAGLPGNVEQIAPRGPERFLLGSADFALTLGQEARTAAAPSTLQPDPLVMDGVTAGWLVASERAGRIPEPSAVIPAHVDLARLRVSLELVEGGPGRACVTVPTGVPIELLAGETITTKAVQMTVGAQAPGRPPVVAYYGNWFAGADPTPISLRAVRDLTVVVQATAPGPTPVVRRCGGWA